MRVAALAALRQLKTSFNTMDKKKERRPHNDTLNTLFKDILNSYSINWTDGTSTTKSPTGQIITYKKLK